MSSVPRIDLENQRAELTAALAAAHRRISELAAAASSTQPEPDRARRDFRFRTLFTSNILGINLADSRGKVSVANDCFLAMLGYERSDLPLDWMALTPPEWLATDRAKIEEFRATGAARPWEKELRHRDGHRVPVLIAVARLEQGDYECLAVVLDLSETKRAQAALRSSEERYRSLYENIPLMYFALDTGGTLLSVNSYGAAELGYEPEELIGCCVLDLFHPDDREAAGERLAAFAENPRSVVRWEFRKLRKDGSELWVSETVWAARRPNGELGILVVAEDVTERKLAERRLALYQQSLRRLSAEAALGEERTRRRIATGLHDDVGQALATAQMRAATLRRRLASGETADLVDEIRDLLGRSIDSVRSLTFELSSPILRELGLEAALQDLGSRTAEANGLAFRFSSHGDLEAPGDRVGIVLYRAVRELLHNVAKHARARAVHLSLEAAASGVHVTVEDDGVGFDTSRWVERSAERGFGLFSVREQAGQFGYRLEIDSAPGRGTRAALLAPASAGAEAARGKDQGTR